MTGVTVNGLEVVRSQDLVCDNCNTCCQSYSKVDVNVTDVFQIAGYLDMTPDEFFARYCKVVVDREGNWTTLFDIEGGCKFHVDGKCAIYPVRPNMCAFYPFSYTSLITSGGMKTQLGRFPTCFIHKLPDDLLVVPDIERMIDSRILFMVLETYTVGHESRFSAAEAEPYHQRGLAMLRNPRMREITYRKMLTEFYEDIPADPDTGEPLLTQAQVKEICDRAREACS